MAEQVSHHPPISAFYAEGKGYYSYGNTNVKQNFWGSSIEFKCIGLKHTILTDTNEHITIKRPENSANNLIIGTLYIDVHGIVEVHNVTKNIKAVIDISRQNWSNRTPFGFTGKITDQYDNVKMLVEGTWNKDYYLKDPLTGVKEKIFTADVRPANSAR